MKLFIVSLYTQMCCPALPPICCRNGQVTCGFTTAESKARSRKCAAYDRIQIPTDRPFISWSSLLSRWATHSRLSAGSSAVREFCTIWLAETMAYSVKCCTRPDLPATLNNQEQFSTSAATGAFISCEGGKQMGMPPLLDAYRISL